MQALVVGKETCFNAQSAMTVISGRIIIEPCVIVNVSSWQGWVGREREGEV